MDVIVRNILLGIALAAPVGPAGIAVIQNGLNHGFLNAFLTGLGITLADTTYLLIVFFGISTLMEIHIVKIIIWALGIIILMYLGIQSIKSATKKVEFNHHANPMDKNPLLFGYLVNISNPLAIVFWVGIFGSLIDKTETGAKFGVLMSNSTILVGILMWHFSMALLSNWGKRYLNEKTVRYFSIAAGIVLILFGIKLAIQVVMLIRS